MRALPPDVRRPDAVPDELAPAWDLLETGDLSAIVVDVDGGALWSSRPATERHRELGRRLRARGQLHASLTPETFAVLRERADAEAGDDAALAAVWAAVPEWCFPGTTRAGVLADELEVLADCTVPDPDVALLLEAASLARLPVSAISHGRLADDQVRRRLEHPALDVVTWRAVRTRSDHGAPDLHLGVPRAGRGPVLLLSGCGPTPVSSADLRVVRLGAPGDGAPGTDLVVRRAGVRAAAPAGMPAPLRDAWDDGARVLGPILVGYAEWAVRHAAGHPGGRLLCLTEPGALLPELLAEIVTAERRPLRVDAVPITRELLIAAAADDTPIAAGLSLALGPRRDAPAGVAPLLGLDPAQADIDGMVATLRDDPAARERVAGRAAALREATISCAGDEPVLPIVDLDHTGALQTALAILLRRAGRPRHLVGLHPATDSSAASAALGEAGGEVHGYLCSLGQPADAHARAEAVLDRLARVAGAPEGGRTSLEPAAPPPDDLDRLRTDAARHGVRAFLRLHLRLRATAGDAASLHDAGPSLVAAQSPGTGGRAAEQPGVPPAWIASVVAPLERELAAARAEVARRDEIVASRAYRAALRARGAASRLRRH